MEEKSRFCIEIEMEESDYNSIGFSGGMTCQITCANGDQFTGEITIAKFGSMENDD